MTCLFENVQPGDQVEMPARKVPWYDRDRDQRNPDRTAKIAVVTHRWHDPVEKKDYVALAMIRKGGVITEPTEKRSIRGLAQAGWRPAQQDWIEWAKSVEEGHVVLLHNRGKNK